MSDLRKRSYNMKVTRSTRSIQQALGAIVSGMNFECEMTKSNSVQDLFSDATSGWLGKVYPL
jgi:hypothetical protein